MLKVIEGGRSSTGTWPDLVVAERYAPPFPVHVRAVPDDTFGVLGADPGARISSQHPIRVMTAAHDAEEAPGGSVIWQAGGANQPWRALVVIHDLARRTSWRERWIATGLDVLLADCRSRRIDSLALPLLGSVHGRLLRPRCVELIVEALRRADGSGLQRIWIVVDRGWEEAVATELALHLDRQG